jgi:hypothetical protein
MATGLNSRLDRNLVAYSAAAGAACACSLFGAPAAEAKIVYTKAHVLVQNNQPFALDLDNDGKIDFYLLQNRSIGAGGSGQEWLSVCHRPVNGSSKGYLCVLSTSASNSLNAVRVIKSSNRDVAAALHAGKKIKNGQRFLNKVAARMGEVAWETFSSKSYWGGPWMDGGKGVRNRYLGLKFEIKNKFHFGWARLTVTTTPPRDFKATLTGYAYETVPSRGLKAGQIKSAAENTWIQTVSIRPTIKAPTLGHLAAGASAISAGRTKHR